MKKMYEIFRTIKNNRDGIGFIEYLIGALVTVAVSATVYSFIGGSTRTKGGSLGADINNFKVNATGSDAAGNTPKGGFTSESSNTTVKGINLN